VTTAMLMLIFMAAACVAQASLFLPFPWTEGVRIPFLTATVLYYAVGHGVGWAFAAALIAGCLHDALGGLPLGLSVVAYAAVALLAGRFRGLIVEQHLLLLALLGAGCSGGIVLTTGLLLRAQGALLLASGEIAWRALWTGALGGAATPLFALVAAALDRVVGNTGRRETEAGLE
jgi:rod shape-determining protein MreD